MVLAKKRFFCLFTVLVMLLMVNASVMAAGANSSAVSMVNPEFYTGEVYIRNSDTGTEVLLSTTDWSWGATQPSMMHVSYADYVYYSGLGYDGWRIVFKGKTRDCTEMRFYDRNKITLYESDFDTDSSFKISFYVKGLVSEELFRADLTVGGITWRDTDMGGFRASRP